MKLKLFWIDRDWVKRANLSILAFGALSLRRGRSCGIENNPSAKEVNFISYLGFLRDIKVEDEV